MVIKYIKVEPGMPRRRSEMGGVGLTWGQFAWVGRWSGERSNGSAMTPKVIRGEKRSYRHPRDARKGGLVGDGVEGRLLVTGYESLKRENGLCLVRWTV